MNWKRRVAAVAAAAVTSLALAAGPALAQPTNNQRFCFTDGAGCSYVNTNEYVLAFIGQVHYTTFQTTGGNGQYLQQAGTNKCVTFDLAGGSVLDMKTCNDLVSQEWAFLAGEKIRSYYNQECAVEQGTYETLGVGSCSSSAALITWG